MLLSISKGLSKGTPFIGTDFRFSYHFSLILNRNLRWAEEGHYSLLTFLIWMELLRNRCFCEKEPRSPVKDQTFPQERLKPGGWRLVCKLSSAVRTRCAGDRVKIKGGEESVSSVWYFPSEWVSEWMNADISESGSRGQSGQWAGPRGQGRQGEGAGFSTANLAAGRAGTRQGTALRTSRSRHPAPREPGFMGRLRGHPDYLISAAGAG